MSGSLSIPPCMRMAYASLRPTADPGRDNDRFQTDQHRRLHRRGPWVAIRPLPLSPMPVGAIQRVPGRGQGCETNSLAAAIAEAWDLATLLSFRVDATVMSLSPDAIVTWLSTPWGRVWVKPIEFGTPTSYEATGALAILALAAATIAWVTWGSTCTTS